MRMTTLCLGTASVLLFTNPVFGQQAPTKEFGVDLSIASIGQDGADDRLLSVGAPVDVRIGFLTTSRVGFETRFGLSYLTDGDGSLLRFSPALNAMFGMGGPRGHLGPYFTGGVLLDVVRLAGTGSDDTETQLGMNVGIGTRVQWTETSAFRTELFVTKKFEKGNVTAFDSDYVPGALAFGLRLGFSFFN